METQYLSKIIGIAAEKIGSKKALAEYLNIGQPDLSQVISGRRGLPAIAQAKLEELMELQQGSLRAASEIITEKKAGNRAYWEKKLETMTVSICAIVILIASPSPGKAQEINAVSYNSLNSMYIMSNQDCNAFFKNQRIIGKSNFNPIMPVVPSSSFHLTHPTASNSFQSVV